MPENDELQGVLDFGEEQESQEELADSSQEEKHTPPEGSKRWNEVYARMKQYERELESVREEKESLRQMVEEMKSFNRQLASAIEGKKAPEVSIAELKRQRREALEALDYDTAEEINEKILDLKLKEAMERVMPQRQANVDTESMRDIKRFIESTEWYKKNPEMRMYANQLDATLLLDPEWIARPARERLAEVKRLVEARFGYKGGKPSASAVESSKYGGSGAGMKLSEDELRLAKAFGITPEEWLKQKNIIRGGKHE